MKSREAVKPRDSCLDFFCNRSYMRLGNSAAEIPVKFQSDAIIITFYLAASILQGIWRWDIRRLIEQRSRTVNGRKARHDDVIKWKRFPRYWPFVRGIHRSPVNSPHKGQWRGAFMLSLICVWINGWVNNRKARDLRRYCTHYDVTLMKFNVIQMHCALPWRHMNVMASQNTANVIISIVC